MAGLRSMSSPRLRCTLTLRTIVERPPESEAGVEGKALEACVVRSGEAGMGGGAWLCQSTAGMRPASSARLRCAGTLWAVAGRPLTHIYFGRECAARAGAPGGRWSAHGVVAAARPTAGRLQSIPRDPHAMEAGTARLRARPHSILRTRVLFDCAAAWTRLGVRVTRGRQPRRQRRDWLTCTAGGGENSTNTESGHDGGWRLRVAAVANCEAADRFVN